MRDLPSQASLVLTISARTPNGLRELAGAYATRLLGVSVNEVRAVCVAATLDRSHEEHRLLVVSEDVDTLTASLFAFRDNGLDGRVGMRTNRVSANPSIRIGAICRGELSPVVLAGLPEACEQSELLREAVARRARAIAPLTPWSPEYYFFSRGVDADVDAEIRRCVALTLEVAVIDALQSVGVKPAAVLGSGKGAMPAAVANGKLALTDAIRAVLDSPSGLILNAAAGDHGCEDSVAHAGTSFDLLVDAARGEDGADEAVTTLLGCSSAPCSLIAGLGELHVAGAELDWARAWGSPRRHVNLPHYPFQRRRFWFDQVGGARSREDAATRIADQQSKAA
jgi:acyl transferase domain-containing protein